MTDARIGIRHIAEYRPERRLRNPEIIERFGFEEAFLSKKLGIEERPITSPDEFSSDIAVHAIESLCAQSDLKPGAIDCLVVVTQTPDRMLPNVASIVHGKMGLPKQVAAFDINLGCSGFVYGLATIIGFMRTSGLSNGVLVTAETYSKIMDPQDRNTVPLFGDAATASWMTADRPLYQPENFILRTDGDNRDAVFHSGSGTASAATGYLVMDGREIFNFMMREVPGAIEECLARNETDADDIDLWVFHQASRFMLETLVKRLKLDPERVPIDVAESGNTVASTIPYILARGPFAHGDPLGRQSKILICGFGVGLSWGATVLQKTQRNGEWQH